jgi:Right handed beta helix region
VFFELQKDMWPPPRGLKILGCHCTGNRFGISDWGADGLIVADCVMLENKESGFDVSRRGTAGVAGRGGLLSSCVLDANGKDGVCFDGTPGPYTVRGNRISNNSGSGYRHWQMEGKEDPPREIALDGNDIFGNGGDGVRFEREVIDACLSGNRIRRNRGQAVALHAAMPGLWREGNRESWS